MAWTYKQSTGALTDEHGQFAFQGYSGHLAGLNNPAMEQDPDVGPLPQGQYAIGARRLMPRLGPVAMPLTPDPTTQLFGRGGFWIHGDFAGDADELASHGCIVLDRPHREIIASSGDTVLQVVP